MRASMRLTRHLNDRSFRHSITFTSFRFKGSMTSQSFRVDGQSNRVQVITVQTRAEGAEAAPRIGYLLVNARTDRPVTDRHVVAGVRMAHFAFVVPAGTYKLKIVNEGEDRADVRGVLLYK
ncbi:hypothetical protein [Paenibacillus sp. GCM10023250]|uniref:hypothetical protein n=1 Tax=Paenibacillus sp. GCM10023250 TaxID=3252648 RepID=UPI00361EFAB3